MLSQDKTSDRVTKAKSESYYRGNLSYKLHIAQRDINKTYQASTQPLFVGNCSRQWGKSFWAVCKAVEQAIKKDKSQIRYGAAFQTDLVEFIIPAFEKVLEDCPEDIKPKHRKAGSRYVFPNGSIIKLVGLDKNPNGLRGNTLDLIILDECGFVSNLNYIYKSVIIPATTHRPDARIILISTPPSTPAHSFVEYCQKAQLEGGYAVFTIFDNPMVDELTIKRLMKESGGEGTTTWKREYLCQFILDDDLALVKEWRDEFIQEVPRDEYFQYYHCLVGQDLGRKDATALLFGYYDFKRAALIIEDEITMDGPAWTTITLKDDVLKKEKELWQDKAPYRRISDNNNPHLLSDLHTLHGIHFMPVKKDASLEQMVNRVREYVAAGRIIIHPRCSMLIGNMKFGVWDKHRREFARNDNYGHFDHFAALQYMLIHLPITVNPIPVTHGFVNQTAWLGNTKNQHISNNAKAFKQVFDKKKPT